MHFHHLSDASLHRAHLLLIINIRIVQRVFITWVADVRPSGRTKCFQPKTFNSDGLQPLIAMASN